MKLKAFTLLFFILCLFQISFAENKEFDSYAKTQSQAMRDAYAKRDINVYNKLLNDFVARYNQLDAQDKKFYTPYLTDGYYNLSCAYSLLGQKKEAIVYLDKAIKAGYRNYAHILEDTDLDNIRKEAGYIALITPLRSVGDYMYIIKKAKDYNTADNRPLPAFTYQDSSNANLMALRKNLKLDSIAGTGNDVSKIINLLYWIHNLVPHDGNHDNPAVRNAMSMIAVCKRDNRGLNCRGLSTVLNECYLSLGIKSRFVTCLPKDSLGVDNDCHVINMVYVNSLKKWVWIDATFCAYVMDEKGQMLGIQEVRERIIDGRQLIVNPDANWNHKSSETKEAYLYNYMAKNLYRLECPTSSEYDLETRTPGKTLTYIDLLPLEYFKQKPDKTNFLNKNNNVSFVNYNTNNPNAFWAAPGK